MKDFFGFLNALPLSILMWVLLLLLYATGNVDKVTRSGWFFIVDMKEAGWFFRVFFKQRNFLCLGFGNVVLVNDTDFSRKSRLIDHEICHCRQCFLWGILFPFLYFLESVRIYFFDTDVHPYYDNIFEIRARVAAGQPLVIPKSMWKVDRWFFF